MKSYQIAEEIKRVAALLSKLETDYTIAKMAETGINIGEKITKGCYKDKYFIGAYNLDYLWFSPTLVEFDYSKHMSELDLLLENCSFDFFITDYTK